MHRIGFTVVQIILRHINGERLELNQYEKCVANKLVNGKQCTLVWFVDYNKVSHTEAKVV